jgi:hypothetical protein
LMNGLYSFCDLSVMQQAFWAHCNPSICCKDYARSLDTSNENQVP